MNDKADKHINNASSDLYEILKNNAKANRLKPTLLWQHLRGRQLCYKFRRQHAILDYIADFYCNEKNLIIEVDGGYHNGAEQIIHDEARTKRLENKGYQVLRFSNEEIINNINETINKIKDILYYEQSE